MEGPDRNPKQTWQSYSPCLLRAFAFWTVDAGPPAVLPYPFAAQNAFATAGCHDPASPSGFATQPPGDAIVPAGPPAPPCIPITARHHWQRVNTEEDNGKRDTLTAEHENADVPVSLPRHVFFLQPAAAAFPLITYHVHTCPPQGAQGETHATPPPSPP